MKRFIKKVLNLFNLKKQKPLNKSILEKSVSNFSVEWKVIDVDSYLENLKKFFPNYTFYLDIQGAGWKRIFIKNNKTGFQIGRINFAPFREKHRIYGYKKYKFSKDLFFLELSNKTFKGV